MMADTMASTSASVAVASTSSGQTAVQRTASLTTRPARKQVTHRELDGIRQTHDRANQAGISYNIWYNKYSGGDQDDGRTTNTKASTRVRIARDAGYTRANAQGGAYVCLFFARGYCPNGEDCTFLHALPIDVPDQGHDVFGREKHGTFRDDMGGVGTIQRVNKTLYVGRIVEEAERQNSRGGMANGVKAAAHSSTRKDVKWNAFSKGNGKGWDRSMDKQQMGATEKVLHRHFGEFGEIERIRVLHSRGCGFVTYVREVDAQFAKEAMMHQSLDHDECINLRWATDDPNPAAQKRDRSARERQGREAMQASLSEGALAAEQSLLELEGGDRDDIDAGKSKRQKWEISAVSNDEEERETHDLSEEAYQKLVEENQRNWQEMERQDAHIQATAMAELEERKEAEAAKAAGQETNSQDERGDGSLHLDASSIRAIQKLRQRQASLDTTPSANVQASSALSGLANYESDSEEE